jgi:hypothetical protein
VIRSQPRQIVPRALSQKYQHKNRAGGVTQGEGPEFKPQNCKRKKRIGYLWVEGVPEVVDNLPSKHKALSSNPSATKKTKQNKNPSKFTFFQRIIPEIVN